MEFISRVVDAQDQDILSTKPVEYFQKGTAATDGVPLMDAYKVSAKEIREVLARPMLELVGDTDLTWPDYVKYDVPSGMGVYCRNVKMVQSVLNEQGMSKFSASAAAAVGSALKKIADTAPQVYAYLEKVYPKESAALEKAAREAVAVARMGSQGWSFFYYMAKKLDLWAPIADTVNVIHTYVGLGVSALVEGATMAVELLQLTSDPTEDDLRFVSKYALWTQNVKNLSIVYNNRLTNETADIFYRRHVTSYTKQVLPELKEVCQPLLKKDNLRSASGTHPAVKTILHLVADGKNEQALKYVIDHLDWLAATTSEIDDSFRTCFICMIRSATGIQISVALPIIAEADDLKLLDVKSTQMSSFDTVAAQQVLGGIPATMKKRVESLMKNYQQGLAAEVERDDLFFESLINPSHDDTFVMQEQMELLDLLVRGLHDTTGEGPTILEIETAVRAACGQGLYDAAAMELLLEQASMAVSRDIIDEVDPWDEEEIASLIGMRGGKEEEVDGDGSDEEPEDFDEQEFAAPKGQRAREWARGIDPILVRRYTQEEKLSELGKEELKEKYVKCLRDQYAAERNAAEIMAVLEKTRSYSTADLRAAFGMFKAEDMDDTLVETAIETLVKKRILSLALKEYIKELMKRQREPEKEQSVIEEEEESSKDLVLLPQEQQKRSEPEKGLRVFEEESSKDLVLLPQEQQKRSNSLVVVIDEEQQQQETQNAVSSIVQKANIVSEYSRMAKIDFGFTNESVTFEDLQEFIAEFIPPKILSDLQSGEISNPQVWIAATETDQLLVDSLLGLHKLRAKCQAIRKEFRRRVNERENQSRLLVRRTYILMVLAGIYLWIYFTFGFSPVHEGGRQLVRMASEAKRYMGLRAEDVMWTVEDTFYDLTDPLVRGVSNLFAAPEEFVPPLQEHLQETRAIVLQASRDFAETVFPSMTPMSEEQAILAAEALRRANSWTTISFKILGEFARQGSMAAAGVGNVVTSVTEAPRKYLQSAAAEGGKIALNATLNAANETYNGVVNNINDHLADTTSAGSYWGSVVRGTAATLELVGTVLEGVYTSGGAIAYGAHILSQTGRGILSPTSEILNVFALITTNQGWKATGVLMSQVLRGYLVYSVADCTSLIVGAASDWKFGKAQFSRALRSRLARPSTIHINRILSGGTIMAQITLYPVFLGYYAYQFKRNTFSFARIPLIDIPTAVEVMENRTLRSVIEKYGKKVPPEKLVELERIAGTRVLAIMAKLQLKIDQEETEKALRLQTDQQREARLLQAGIEASRSEQFLTLTMQPYMQQQQQQQQSSVQLEPFLQLTQASEEEETKKKKKKKKGKKKKKDEKDLLQRNLDELEDLF